MSTITITKKEYKELLEKKVRYENLKRVMEEDIFSTPPTRDAREILSAFQASRRHNKKFLKSLKRGLERSSYFKP